MSTYTLLVDESGTDQDSARLLYVGCLVETSDLPVIEASIRLFNRLCLEDPQYSGLQGLVNNEGEARHYAEDHPSLVGHFIGQTLSEIACRVYAVMNTRSGSVETDKRALLARLLYYVDSTRRIKLDDISVIIERSGKSDRALTGPNIVFHDKSYLPLSIVDYFGGVIHRFHEARIKLLNGEIKVRPKDLNGPTYLHYKMLVDRFAIEIDLVTRERSARGNRFFWKQIESIVKSD